MAFDRDPVTRWYSAQGLYSDNGDYTGLVQTTDEYGTVYSGEFLQVSMPEAIALSKLKILQRQDSQDNADSKSPHDFVLLGSSDNGTSWSKLIEVRDYSNWVIDGVYREFHCNVAKVCNLFRLVILKVGVILTTGPQVVISEIELVSEPINEKSFIVDSPRAYDTYRVNVTKTPYNLIEFPTGPMTADTTIIDGFLYTASASSSATNSFDWPVWAAFNKKTAHTSPYGWATNGGLYDSTTGDYLGSATTTADLAAIRGEWVQLYVAGGMKALGMTIVSAKPSG
eukprot:scaffold237853_cov44-Tisochrysis_lutea.AAC.1